MRLKIFFHSRASFDSVDQLYHVKNRLRYMLFNVIPPKKLVRGCVSQLASKGFKLRAFNVFSIVIADVLLTILSLRARVPGSVGSHLFIPLRLNCLLITYCEQVFWSYMEIKHSYPHDFHSFHSNFHI